jgi:hypothetical protein
MIKELDSVVLTTDLPEYRLESGDIGTVVMVHSGGAGYEVEFVTLDGRTVAVTTLLSSQLRPIAKGEIAHARPVAEAPVLARY